MGRQSQSLIGLSLVGLAALLLILSGTMPALAEEKARLALTLGLLSLAGLGLGIGLQRDAGIALRQILVWSASVVAIAVLFNDRTDVRRLAEILLPASAARPAAESAEGREPGQETVTLRAEENGHFFASALVDGTAVDFLVDTGATDVALAPEDAVRLGIDLSKLTYDIPVSTANGQTFAASAELGAIVIGPIRIEHITATIPRGALTRSLLGMGFLRRLSSFSIDSDRLVMHQ